MKNKKYLFSISLLISLLIILIPIAVATELETYDNLVLKIKEEKISLYQNLGEDPYVTDSGQLNDPGQACIEQHKETSSFADSLDNSVISTLEKIATILFTICTTMSAIDTVISTISIVIGMLSGACCAPTDPTAPARCAASEVKFRAWSAVYAVTKPLCCFVNCGWCTGGDCFSILGVDLSKISLGAIPNIGIAGPGSGIAQFGLSPYDNIYTAIGCLCPIAIIFNLRKLKTIYDVYDCCIQEACANGLSTEACERQLDEATCMYWEGSLYSIIAKILISILIGFIASKLIEVIGLSQLLACVYAVLKIAQVPIVIKNVMSAWKYMSRSFKGIDCEDLGFDDVKEEILEDWQYVTLVDKDDDGVYDYNVPEWTKGDNNKYTTTLRLWDDKKKEYVIKSFTKTKEEGKLLATITDEEGNKVSTLEWEELKGKNVPARVNIYSDGSASVGYILYDKVEIKENSITFTGTDKEGKQISETFDLSKPSQAQYIVNGFGLDKYKLGKVTNAEGNTINFENGEVEIVNLGDKDKPQVLEITPKDQVSIRVATRTLVGTDGSIVKITQPYEKDEDTFVPKNIELTINGKSTQISPENFKNMPIDNPEQIAQAFTALDEPKKGFNYDKGDATFFVGDSYKDSQNKVKISEGGMKISGKDGPGYEYELDINNQGEFTEFRYGGLNFNGEQSTQEGIDVYHTISEVKDNEDKMYKVGIDSNGEVWLGTEEDDKIKWTPASDKLGSLNEDSKRDIKEKQKYSKKAMELKTQNEKQAKEKIEEEKKPTKDKETIAREELEQKVAYQMMYEILWTILDYTLGEKVDDMIEDKCKEDYEASYPPSDIPSESGGPAECEDTENNVYNAQFISKTEQNDNTCQYKVTYGIGACNHEINFVVQFQGTGSNENIEGGTLAQGQSVSRKRIITSNLCTHQRICIIIKGEDAIKCFPPINQEGGLI